MSYCTGHGPYRGFRCHQCIEVGDTVRLVKLSDDDARDEASCLTVGVTGKVIDDPDGDETDEYSVCVEWAMPINPVVWTVPVECVEKTKS